MAVQTFYPAFSFVPRIVERITGTAPAGADLTSRRHGRAP